MKIRVVKSLIDRDVKGNKVIKDELYEVVEEFNGGVMVDTGNQQQLSLRENEYVIIQYG